MEKFIGTKIVQAEPAHSVVLSRVGCATIAETLTEKEIQEREDNGWAVHIVKEGYKVVYKGGYESWSPKKVFEDAYRRTDGLNFGLALEAAKMGKRIARKGWNGKNQYVELGTDFLYDTIGGNGNVVYHEDIGSKALVFVGTRGRQVGWLASQADMLADDWMILE